MFVNSIQTLLKLPTIQPRNGVITFGFVDGLQPISTTTQNNIRYIFKNLIEPFINVRFVEVSGGEGDINFQLYDASENSNYPSYAYAYGHDVFLAQQYDNTLTVDGFKRGFGSHGFMTLIHETLHTMGLGHPGNYNGEEGRGTGPFLPYDLDNTTNSLMSYNLAGKSAITPMPYDVMALQSIYGTHNLNAGSTTYRFSSVYSFSDGKRDWGNAKTASKLTLWDRSGTDILDFSNLRYESSGYLLDVRAGGLITTGSAYNQSFYQPADAANPVTDFQSTSKFGTRITFNTQIEQVVGSSSNDTILGGLATREILGRAGQDTLYGSDRNDLILGGEGSDVIFGGHGNDQLAGGNGNSPEFNSDFRGDDILYGGSGKDKLWGESGDDQLFGQDGNDELIGGHGNDILAGSERLYSHERDELHGGLGRDWFILGSELGSFYQYTGFATIKDWQGGLDKIVLGRTSGRYETRAERLSGGAALDTTIYHNSDLIGVIEDSINVNASRDFVFA